MQEVGDDPVDLKMKILSTPTMDINGARQLMHRAILVVRSLQLFSAGNHGSSRVFRDTSYKSIGNGHENRQTVRYESMEAVAVDVMDASQTASLIIPTDNTLCSRQLMTTLVRILYSRLMFKERATSSTTNDYDHHSSSEVTERVAEAGDNLTVLSEHHITIGQTTTKGTIVNQLQTNQKENILRIVGEQKLRTLQAYGGLSAVAEALHTDLDTGISKNGAIHHSKKSASSRIRASASKFSYLVLEALINRTTLLLFLVATLAIGFGIIDKDIKNGWHDGVVLLISIVTMVLFTSICKFQQERRTGKKLEKQHSAERRLGEIDVIRGGEVKHISKSKLVRGDVVLLKRGCQVPADGLFIAGQSLELAYGSESCMIDEHNPFLSYGDRIIDGDGRMVVTSIDAKSGWREIMSNNTSSYVKFNFEAQLDKLNICIHITGLIICILILIVLFLRYMFGKRHDNNGYGQESGEEPTAMRAFANSFESIIRGSKNMTRALIKVLGVSLVGVTQGLPFVISFAILYCNDDDALCGKATKQDSLVAVDMALITTICMGTICDFTEDEMEVDKLFIGVGVINGCTMLASDVVEMLCDGIGISIEKAVVHWAKDKLGFKKEKTTQRWKILKKREKNPFEEPCGVLMRATGESEETLLHMHGPVKEILKKCTHYYDSKGCKVLMDDQVTRFFNQADQEMQHKQLRTIAFACKRTNTQTLDADDLVLVALLGLKSRSKEVTKAEVNKCRKDGIKTIMVSSKKVSILQDIALQCGVITYGDSESLVITGEAFRKLTNKERIEIVDKIRVMGEALPFDKLLLVETLRKKGEVVAFLGQRTDESPTLKEANVGIAMGTWSSMQARESCDIIIWDGSFGDLIRMVHAGKCIYENIQRFLQHFLTMSISSTLINLLGAITLGDAPLTTLDLVWVNVVVTFIGGYVSLTKTSIDKPVTLIPRSYKRSLITSKMMRNISAQVLYQAISCVVLQAIGLGAVVSNSFILCQLFNLLNTRELENKNIFRGISGHVEFWIGGSIFIVLQVGFVRFEEWFDDGTKLDWKLWVGCFVIGSMSWLVDWLGKCMLVMIRMCYETSQHLMRVVSFGVVA